MTGRHSAKTRRTAPALEGLEDRRLMNARIITPSGKPINDKDLARFQVQKQNNVPLSDRRIAYTTPQGTNVQLTLFGFGTLAGTKVRPDGSLDLVYNHTTNTSKLVGHVSGGTGMASLASLRDADVVARSPTTTGSDPISVVNLKKFRLLRNGYINIEGGVGTLALASAGTNSQIHIGLLPPVASTSSNTGATTIQVNQTNTGSISTALGSTVTVSPSASSAAQAKPTGAQVTIPFVDAAPRTTALGDAQVFGFDPVAGALVRFDAIKGQALQRIAVPGGSGGSAIAGVGLGRSHGRLVALVGVGSTVFAYDVVDGTSAGRFTTASLAAEGITRVDGIGSSDTRTFVSDASAGVNGLIQGLDVTASLDTGQAVASGLPFAPLREFELSGGVTGLAGSDVIYTTGAAHFDTFVPDRVQLGVLAFSPSAILPRESSRVAIPGLTTSTIDAGVRGATRANPTAALGSIAGNLALVSGVVDGKNVVTLFTPSSTSLTNVGTVTLADPNRLSGLSESFHPELEGGALLDVTNNLRSFVSQRATGLVINASGAINLVQIKSATDTAIVGRPLNHVNIPNRKNVTLISTARGSTGKDTANGVTIQSTARPIGVLTLP